MSSLDVLPYARLGTVFVAANAAAATVSVVGTAMTGLILYNPVGSGKKLALVRAGFSWTTAPAAVHNVGIALGAISITLPATNTAVNVRLADGTGNAGNAIGLAYSISTLPAAPVAARWLGGAVYGSGVAESPYAIDQDIGGEILVVPGSTCSLIALTTACVGVGSFTWIEVPA